MQAIRSKQLPGQPSLESSRRKVLWEISTACWDFTPKNRVTVGAVIAILIDATTQTPETSELMAPGMVESASDRE